MLIIMILYDLRLFPAQFCYIIVYIWKIESCVQIAEKRMSSQSQSYITTDGQSASLSWYQASIWGPRPYFRYCHIVADLLMWGALSDERTRLPCKIAVALASAVILGSEPRGTHDHILLSQIRDSPNLEGQVPVFISPRNKVAQLYPQALGQTHVSVRVTLRLAIGPLILTTSNFIFQVNTFGYSPYAISSLTRGWISRLQLLLVLAIAVILRPESSGTRDHILLSQI
jgi:hypothetical protein